MKSRRSIRLKGYDYSQAGAYFVTICVQDRQCLFGNVMDGKMNLNNAGEMINKIWHEIPEYYPGIDIDAYQIMPNHIHGIIMIGVGAGPCACPPMSHRQPDDNNGNFNDGPNDGQPRDGQNDGQPRGVAPTTAATAGLSLPDVVRRFKTMTTKKYIDGVKQYGWQRFNKRTWQRNYYEHIIRNDDELYRIIKYIKNNPAQWHSDRENPNPVVGAGPRACPNCNVKQPNPWKA